MVQAHLDPGSYPYMTCTYRPKSSAAQIAYGCYTEIHYAECRIIYCYALCRNTEFRYFKRHYAKFALGWFSEDSYCYLTIAISSVIILSVIVLIVAGSIFNKHYQFIKLDLRNLFIVGFWSWAHRIFFWVVLLSIILVTLPLLYRVSLYSVSLC